MDGIPVTGVNELVLEALDLSAAEHFYAGVLGFAVVSRSEDRVWVMAGDRTRIGLWTPQVGIAQGRGGVHVHYAMHIAEVDLDAALERLRSHGFEPAVVEFEETASKAAYVTDPDGNVVELWTYDVARHVTDRESIADVQMQEDRE
jgi:catechol-2,3-dioxygenase